MYLALWFINCMNNTEFQSSIDIKKTNMSKEHKITQALRNNARKTYMQKQNSKYMQGKKYICRKIPLCYATSVNQTLTSTLILMESLVLIHNL